MGKTVLGEAGGYARMALLVGIEREEQRLVTTPASVTVWQGSRLVKVRRETERANFGDKAPPPRGAQVGLSRGSRTRLSRMLAKVRIDEMPIFVTLTYPDLFDTRHREWKRHIDVLGKRLARLRTAPGFVWRMEFKARKSGQSLGFVAPHYHLLLWGRSEKWCRGYFPYIWYDVVGGGQLDHLYAGTSCEAIRTANGVASYVSKYIAKGGDVPAGWSGRVWGIVGKKNIPFGKEVTVEVSEHVAVMAVRMGRRFAGVNKVDLKYGLTWYMRADELTRWLSAQEK